MKQKVNLYVAGVSFTVITEDEPEYTRSIAKSVNDRINSIVMQTSDCTKLKAAALCAMEYCSENMQQKFRIAELQARVKYLEGKLSKAGGEDE